MSSVMNAKTYSPHISESHWRPEGSTKSGNQLFEHLWQQRSTQTSQGSFAFERLLRKASFCLLGVESSSETNCRLREGTDCSYVPAPPSRTQAHKHSSPSHSPPGVCTSPRQGGIPCECTSVPASTAC